MGVEARVAWVCSENPWKILSLSLPHEGMHPGVWGGGRAGPSNIRIVKEKAGQEPW